MGGLCVEDVELTLEVYLDGNGRLTSLCKTSSQEPRRTLILCTVFDEERESCFES
jgi:hypothetical protein